MSAKPCPKPDCGRPKKKGKQSCEWHWLLRQSSDVQAAASRERLKIFNGSYDYHLAGEHIARKPKSEWPEGERWCAGCQSFVPLFYCTGSRCKACSSIAAHAGRLEKTYGIDSTEYDRIFKLQGGRCAICRNRPATIRFAVDHDHKTDEVRGILCKRCNHELLGGAHDDVAILWRAITYLMSPPAMRAPGFVPSHGLIVENLRRALEAREAEAQRKRPEPLAPPF